MGSKFILAEIEETNNVGIAAVRKLFMKNVLNQLPLKGCELEFCNDVNWKQVGETKLHDGKCDIRVKKDNKLLAILNPNIAYGPVKDDVSRITDISLFVPKRDMKRLKRECAKASQVFLVDAIATHDWALSGASR